MIIIDMFANIKSEGQESYYETTARTMEFKIRIYISYRWFSYWPWCNMEISIYGWGFRWRSILFYLYYFHLIYWIADFIGGIYYRTRLAKKCCFSIYIFCSTVKLAYHRNFRNDYLFYSFIILYCCRRLDSLLYV